MASAKHMEAMEDAIVQEDAPPPAYQGHDAHSSPPPLRDQSPSVSSQAPSEKQRLYREATGEILLEPVVIPQHTTDARVKSHTPFVRAYAPAFARLRNPISQTEFFSFLDAINDAIKSNSALDALSMTGSFISNVPLPIVGSIIGSGLQAASNAGRSSMAKSGRTTKLQEANASIFFPRGLRAEILRTHEMMEAVEMPTEFEDDEDPPIAEFSAPLEFESADSGHKANWMRRMQAKSDTMLEGKHMYRRENLVYRVERQNARDRTRLLAGQRADRRTQKAERKLAVKDWAYKTQHGSEENKSRLWLVIKSIEMGSGVQKGESSSGRCG